MGRSGGGHRDGAAFAQRRYGHRRSGADGVRALCVMVYLGRIRFWGFFAQGTAGCGSSGFVVDAGLCMQRMASGSRGGLRRYRITNDPAQRRNGGAASRGPRGPSPDRSSRYIWLRGAWQLPNWRDDASGKFRHGIRRIDLVPRAGAAGVVQLQAPLGYWDADFARFLLIELDPGRSINRAAAAPAGLEYDVTQSNGVRDRLCLGRIGGDRA